LQAPFITFFIGLKEQTKGKHLICTRFLNERLDLDFFLNRTGCRQLAFLSNLNVNLVSNLSDIWIERTILKCISTVNTKGVSTIDLR